jgi:hypothetical protein
VAVLPRSAAGDVRSDHGAVKSHSQIDPAISGRFQQASDADSKMPPKEECPICLQLVLDWHLEWYDNGSALFRGLMAMDCPLRGCRLSAWYNWFAAR